jgi:SSS family solute:Na+ symporter
MALTVWACVGFALAVNRVVFRRRAEFELGTREAWRNVFSVLRA